MFDKSKCKKCKYHGKVAGFITCEYSIRSASGACVKRKGRDLTDERGDDGENCKLYEQGKPANLTSLF